MVVFFFCAPAPHGLSTYLEDGKKQRRSEKKKNLLFYFLFFSLYHPFFQLYVKILTYY